MLENNTPNNDESNSPDSPEETTSVDGKVNTGLENSDNDTSDKSEQKEPSLDDTSEPNDDNKDDETSKTDEVNLEEGSYTKSQHENILKSERDKFANEKSILENQIKENQASQQEPQDQVGLTIEQENKYRKEIYEKKLVEIDESGRSKYKDWDKKTNEMGVLIKAEPQVAYIFVEAAKMPNGMEITNKLMENPSLIDQVKRLHPAFYKEELTKIMNNTKSRSAKFNKSSKANIPLQDPKVEPKVSTGSISAERERLRKLGII